MEKRIVVVILFSLTVAIAASYFVYSMLARRLGPEASRRETQAIVAVRDLPLGTVIHESDLTTAEISSNVQGKLTSKQDVIGRGVTTGIYKGEPILEARLNPKGAGGGLAGLIKPGMRAAAVRVNEVVGVSGFVRPGMHVDVITSGAPPDAAQRNTGTIARIVLQNLEVLSVGQDLDRDAEGKPVAVQVVNLLVAPEQAETLTLASTEAKVQLILRNPLDTQIARTPGTNTSAMFNAGDVRPAVSAPAVYRRPVVRAVMQQVAPPPQPVTVEVLNGSKKEIITLGYSKSALRAGGAQ